MENRAVGCCLKAAILSSLHNTFAKSHARGSLRCLTGEWGGAVPEDSQGRLPVIAEIEALLDAVGDEPWSYSWLPSVHSVRAAACLAAGGLLRAAGKMPQALSWLDRGRASVDAAHAQQGIDLQVRTVLHQSPEGLLCTADPGCALRHLISVFRMLLLTNTMQAPLIER